MTTTGTAAALTSSAAATVAFAAIGRPKAPTRPAATSNSRAADQTTSATSFTSTRDPAARQATLAAAEARSRAANTLFMVQVDSADVVAASNTPPTVRSKLRSATAAYQTAQGLTTKGGYASNQTLADIQLAQERHSAMAEQTATVIATAKAAVAAEKAYENFVASLASLA